VTICKGGSVQLNAGSGGIRYSWSPSNGLNDPNINNPIANPIQTTTYLVGVDYAGGCSASAQVEVLVIDLPVNAGADQYVCKGACVQLSGSSRFKNKDCLRYEWYYISLEQTIDGMGNPVIIQEKEVVSNEKDFCLVPDMSLEYHFRVIDDCNGCEETDAMMVTVLPSWDKRCQVASVINTCCIKPGSITRKSEYERALSNQKIREQLVVSPNPFKEQLQFKIRMDGSQNIEIRIFDLQGKEVMDIINKQVHGGVFSQVTILTSDLQPGMYIYQIRAGTNAHTGKIIRME